MESKVCKLVRLTSKDDKGKFVKGEKGSQVIVRKKCVVSESSVNESEKNYEKTGMLYIIDEKATELRNKIVEAENEAANGKKLEDIKVFDFKIQESKENEAANGKNPNNDLKVSETVKKATEETKADKL